MLLPNLDIVDVAKFKVTRNAEVGRNEEVAEDLIDAAEEVIEQRRFATVVRLEVDADMAERSVAILRQELDVGEREVFYREGPIDFEDFFELVELDRPELKLPSWTPRPHPRLHPGSEEPSEQGVFEEIKAGDVLVHHPYHSFEGTVQRFLDAAASDPDVLAIKAAIYRTARDSKVIESLIEAARNGKQVAVMVELKARFDEENNLRWADRLEEEGIHVAYGTIGLKTHTKTALVVREEPDGVQLYSHVGTGNYHSETAKGYVDLGLLTADRDVGQDLTKVFNFFTGPSLDDEFRSLLIAPTGMRERFVELGPTFIKLGQLLSTRPDVLPAEYIEELAQLQDRVPPAPWSDAKAVIEDELGPVEEAFDEFDTEPISGASLGQVYTATLDATAPSAENGASTTEFDGDRVAVKVRRPGVESLVEADLRVLDAVMGLLLRFSPPGQRFTLENVASEFAQTIREEMDYGREAAMLTEIRGNLASDDGVAIPDVYEERSGSRVLTMEYVAGTKISEVEDLDELGVDRHAVAETLERSYLQMIIEDGVFHADPHPGNLAVRDDGTVVFYDFGMSGRVDETIQDRIVDFYVAVANQDIEAILDTLVAMGTLSPDADRATMAEVMEIAIADARGEDIEQYRVQQIVSKVEDTIYEFPLRLPSNLALVLRVATVVEGVCLTLDPEFDFVTVATDYLSEEGYYERGAREFLTETAGQARDSTRSSIRLASKLDRTLDRVDRNDFYVRTAVEDSAGTLDAFARRVVTGVLFGSGLVSTGLLYVRADVRAAAALGVATAAVGVLCWRSFRRPSTRRASDVVGR